MRVTAAAAAPIIGSQAPGYYRVMLGDFEITTLSDGTTDLPLETMLTNAKVGEVRHLLAEAFLSSPVRTSINQYLINTGLRLILIDAGAGVFLGPSTGRLEANLCAAGYGASEIDELFITHMHADHVGGLVKNGEIAFPNAVIRVHKNDLACWLHSRR